MERQSLVLGPPTEELGKEFLHIPPLIQGEISISSEVPIPQEFKDLFYCSLLPSGYIVQHQN